MSVVPRSSIVGNFGSGDRMSSEAAVRAFSGKVAASGEILFMLRVHHMLAANM